MSGYFKSTIRGSTMSGGTDMGTSTDVYIKLIEGMSEMRGDVKAMAEVLKSFNEKFDDMKQDVKEIKEIATEAGNVAKNAQNQADSAHIRLDKLEEAQKETQKAQQEARKEQRTQKRWIITSVIAVIAIAVPQVFNLIF